jgi:predicted RNA methylase
MEVRGFVDRPVTQMGESGLTPAAETVLAERFDIGRGQALVAAFEDACERYDEEIELLFDTNSPYTILSPDPDTLETTIEHLDRIPADSWRADDVLGWIYEYYNVDQLDDLRQKGDREGFDPEDVPPANQFYTPHWVVRMLTDNSLGKLYLEDTGELSEAVEAQKSLSPDERKNRPLSPDESPDIADFCTYLVPSEEEGEPPAFDGPRDLRVIDPACGSGHFLLYAFDVLERIYRTETDLDHAEIPREILRNNLYGVDLDMRACQLAAFNLYLKGRTRAEAEGANGFDMPEVGIVCADAKVADTEGVEEVFDEVADGNSDVESALRRILDAFEEVHGLGSLLDVRGTLGNLFEDDADLGGTQLTLGDDPRESHTLRQVLHSLREAVEEHRDGDSFLAQDLRSFVRLLDILVQDYDVALMNPPYGSKGRMPARVQNYVEVNYQYYPNYYVSFFEVCNQLSKRDGRIGMLVPRTFMFLSSYKSFRSDIISKEGGFDFLAEFGNGILDNAKVHTAGTVIRSSQKQQQGSFFRLYDLPRNKKEPTFLDVVSDVKLDKRRRFDVDLSTFAKIPRTPICYSTPAPVRELYDTDVLLDAEHAGVDAQSKFTAIPGLQTSNNARFLRTHWETKQGDGFRPLTKGGENAWITPQVTDMVEWGERGTMIRRSSPSFRIRNEDFYGEPGLTWNLIKQTGRRFGFYPGGLFSVNGLMLFPREDASLWTTMAILNSDLYHILFLSQTIERNWNPGEIGAAPWIGDLVESSEFERSSKEQYEVVLSQRSTESTSPYYIAPSLYPTTDVSFFFDHPHADIARERYEVVRTEIPEGVSIGCVESLDCVGVGR